MKETLEVYRSFDPADSRRFWVQSDQKSQDVTPSSLPGAEAAAAMRPITVVIIEDEEAHFLLMKRAVTKELPFVSVHYFNAAGGYLEKLKEIDADVIVVDYLMPGMNGIELLEVLRRERKDIPVVMITGQGDETVAVRAMKMGAADYLVKSAGFFPLLPGTIERVVREKRLQESLCAVERRFKDLAECTSDWIWEVDTEGRYTYANPVVEGIIGYRPAEIIGRHFYDFFSEQEKAAQQHTVFQLIGTGVSISCLENRLVHKDGRGVIVETSGVPIHDGNGRVVGYRGIDRDITKRKRTERALQQSHRFLDIGNKSHEMSALLREFMGEVKRFTGCAAVEILLVDEHWSMPCRTCGGPGQDGCELGNRVATETEVCMCANIFTQGVERRSESCTAGGSFYRNAITRGPATVGEHPTGSKCDIWSRSGFESVAMVPIRLENRVLGLIHVADPKENMAPFEVLEALEAAGMGLGTAIERVRTSEALRKAHAELEMRVHERTADLVEANARLEKEIADRRSAEMALLASEDELRSIFNIAPVGIALMDMNGRFIEPNDTWCSMLGYSKDELRTMAFGEITRQNGIVVDAATVEQAMCSKEEYYQVEKQYTRKDGTEFWGDLRVTVLHDQDGNPKAMISTIMDLSLRKRMDEELLKVRKLESVRVLAGGIAHDFNNLLTSILGNISLAKMCIPPENRALKNLTSSEKAVFLAEKLTRMLQAFSQAGVPIKKEFQIAEWIKDTVELHLSGSSIRSRYDIPHNLWLVECDPGQLGQVIGNLIINAKEAMPLGGTADVQAENVILDAQQALPLVAGKYVRISVRDHGEGISSQDIDRIFDPYYSTKDRGAQKGMGLGLAIVHSIIAQHAGLVRVESQVGRGTVFRVYLPAA
jgi:PAS domain S-box-containing protein